MSQRAARSSPKTSVPAEETVSASPLDIAGATPMMAQYIEIKAANTDCLLFYRMGDFYELFFEDAEIASRALGIVLTKRGKHGGADIPMCGVPVERSDDYLSRLIALGHRVAVCAQTEDPAEAKKRGPKSVVRREVVRLVTPARSPRTASSTRHGRASSSLSAAASSRNPATPTASPPSISPPAGSRSARFPKASWVLPSPATNHARSCSPRRSIPTRRSPASGAT